MNETMDGPSKKELKSRPAVVCLSGGLDSTALLIRLLDQKRRVYGVSFDYGQKHRLELQRLEDNLAYLAENGLQVDWHLVDLSSLSLLLHSALIDTDWDVPTGHYEQANMRATVVPNRNAIFASIAYAYALSIYSRTESQVDLCLGVHSGDHAIYPDCRPEFYRAIHEAFSLGNWDSENISLYLPYLELDKSMILRDAEGSCSRLGLDFDTVFRNTCTSYQPDEHGRSHGMTGSDVERVLAFYQLGRRDPIDYHLPWDEVLSQALQLESEFKESDSESSGGA